MSDPLKTRRDGHILEVILDRPKANAIDLTLSRQMGEVFQDFRDDPDLRVAIITGGGEKFFSAGWDLKAAADGDAVDGDYGIGGFGGLQELGNLDKPVIAAVNGICCGGGLELALSCDLILAADHATFALPEIRSGTVADAASVKLPKRIPYHIAMEMLFTGRWLDAEEAARWGFVNHIYPADQLLSKAREMADLLASGPPLVYAAIKEIVREAEDKTFQDAMNMITKSQLETVETLYRSEDQLEGSKAFAEGRDPVWKTHDQAAAVFGSRMAGFANVPASRWREEVERHFIETPGGLRINYDPKLRDATLAAFDPKADPPDLWPLFDALAGLPVAGLRGVNSDILSPETFAEMQNRLPLIAAQVADRGHVPFLDEPESVSVLSRWIDALRQQETS